MNFPTEFRGVTWDDGWEFDSPAVIYSPIMRYRIGGNSGEIDSMVEDYCTSLALGETPRRGLSEFEKKEFQWRGWSERGMCRRKMATHVVLRLKWSVINEQNIFEVVERSETYGPPQSAW